MSGEYTCKYYRYSHYVERVPYGEREIKKINVRLGRGIMKDIKSFVTKNKENICVREESNL